MERLLADKLALVTKHYRGGVVVDLCCATGEHLLSLAPGIAFGVGVDFAHRYMSAARQRATEQGAANVTYVQGDARRVPLRDGAAALVYSFSALYAIADVDQVIAEIARVLRPGGVAVLDLGNRASLNTYCLRYYTDWPPTHPISLAHMRSVLDRERLTVLERHCYQILPLWAGLPKHLRFLLHPRWERIMRRRIGARMLDEWVSSLPIVRQFAFRHLLVVRKIGHE